MSSSASTGSSTGGLHRTRTFPGWRTSTSTREGCRSSYTYNRRLPTVTRGLAKCSLVSSRTDCPIAEFSSGEELATLCADVLAVLLSERFDLGNELAAPQPRSRPLPAPA